MSSPDDGAFGTPDSPANTATMESKANREQRIPKAKRGAAPSPSKSTAARSTAPTKFVLKSEKELDRSPQQRGRRMSRSSTTAQQPDNAQTTPTMSMLSDSSFGVQSLEETINSTFSSENNPLSRTTSNCSDKSSNVGDDATDAGDHDGVNSGRKRKAGNRVHPTILAAGQRIISSERMTQAATSSGSSSQSPFRPPTLRRGSNTSSIHMESQPLTPLRLSPHAESAAPSTSRSGSPKSFRLSDEDSVDDTSSQAIMSSIGDEEGQHLELRPQLVMPSLSVPLRRPFTEQGRRIGRARIMVLGQKGVGKTSFINCLYRCEHIVHMEGVSNYTHQSALFTGSERTSTDGFTEIQASTRPYPSWWTELESQRTMLRRSSVGEGVLERNLTFVDTPSLDDDEQVLKIMNHLKMTLRRTTNMESMNDNEVVGLLSGDGGVQIDAAVCLFDPTPSESSDPLHVGLTPAHQELLRCLSKWTNLIPVIGRSDSVASEILELRKKQISHMLELIKAAPYPLSASNSALAGPLAVSCATGEDSEIDASVLMSSQYLPPLVPSELNTLIQSLLDPDNIARMRHLSATKFLLWRQENRGYITDLQNHPLIHSPYFRSQSPGVTSSGSMPEESCKVLIPYSSSSYYRSASPATSDISGNNALANLTQQAHPPEPFRQVRLAKWAQDLQRGLANERRKYTEMYTSGRASEWNCSSDDKAMAMTRPGRGRLGGDLGVIDPRDPLGVLAFGRRGFLVFKVVGGWGLAGAVAYWVMKNWADVQEFFGWQSPTFLPVVNAAAVPPPTSGTRLPVLGWIDEQYLRGFFGWR